MVSRVVLLDGEAEAKKLSSANIRRGSAVACVAVQTDVDSQSWKDCVGTSPAVVCAAVQTEFDSQSPTDRVETSIQVPSPPPSLGGTVSMTVQPQPVEDHSSTGGHVAIIAPAQPPLPPPPPPPASPGLVPPPSPITIKTPKPKKKMKTVNWTKIPPAVASSKFLFC